MTSGGPRSPAATRASKVAERFGSRRTPGSTRCSSTIPPSGVTQAGRLVLVGLAGDREALPQQFLLQSVELRLGDQQVEIRRRPAAVRGEAAEHQRLPLERRVRNPQVGRRRIDRRERRAEAHLLRDGERALALELRRRRRTELAGEPRRRLHATRSAPRARSACARATAAPPSVSTSAVSPAA